jgi:deoxycytidine triphosphate deaminase
MQPWLDLAQSPKPALEDWASILVDVLEEFGTDYQSALNDWPAAYDHDSRAPLVARASEDLGRGVPVMEEYAVAGERWTTTDEDVINAGWVARVERQRTPSGTLVGKSLDTKEFLRQWLDAGGSLVSEAEPEARASGEGVLSEAEIRARVAMTDEHQLVVTPLLPGCIKGVGLDVHLGSRFIAFRRTLTSSFDPLDVAFDPRSMQEEVERAWGERFVLHPNELVLAATLEYLALPGDLSAQVITRSSYGRLGLITATAILVHPHFRGCLTLELLNTGEVPLELTPGQRIAQLMFIPVSPEPPPPSNKYDCPVGPEFSKVRDDEETRVLRMMRERTQAG